MSAITSCRNRGSSISPGWNRPDEPGWFNEVSLWASKEALNDWHMDTYHKHAKEWAANGAIMEDIITNFELVSTRLLRICPTCGNFQDKPYELTQEQMVLKESCPQCGFHFPVAAETPTSTSVFKDLVGACRRRACSDGGSGRGHLLLGTERRFAGDRPRCSSHQPRCSPDT